MFARNSIQYHNADSWYQKNGKLLVIYIVPCVPFVECTTNIPYEATFISIGLVEDVSSLAFYCVGFASRIVQSIGC